MRKGYAVFAAALLAAAIATPMVVNATSALATSEQADTVTTAVAVTPVEVATVAPPASETCTRKIRVVYSGYGTPPAACTTGAAH